jgi:hypothetical protein
MVYKIQKRYVKSIEGLRVFQKQAIDKIQNPRSEILFIEAPVGSGKSYIIRNLLKMFPENKSNQIILTFPTKILMEAQLAALKKDLTSDDYSVSFWDGSNSFKSADFTGMIYSSDSIVRYLKKQNLGYDLNKGQLLQKLLMGLDNFSARSAIVTSPDVLYLLLEKRAYSGSKNLAACLNGGYFFFDEFHLYSGLAHFKDLLEQVLRISKIVVLLSATPFIGSGLQDWLADYKVDHIRFSDSVGNDQNVCFNHELEMEIINCTRKIGDVYAAIKGLIPNIQKPAAVILDSVFRLQHIKQRLKLAFPEVDFREWSGLYKSSDIQNLTGNTVVLGTSSIEVGIEMKFVSLITEATYWTSAIQRIGRIGRMEKGYLYLLTNTDFGPYLNDVVINGGIGRDDFEALLRERLNDPKEEWVSGESFRGDSYPFLLFNTENNKLYGYNETIFSMFDFSDMDKKWQRRSFDEKKDRLLALGINRDLINEFLIRDRLYPYWGFLEGNLSQNYSPIDEVYYDKSDHTLTIDMKSGERFRFKGAQNE